MKKLLLLLFVITTIISGCRKDDNPKLPDLTSFPVPKLMVDPSSSLIIEENDTKENFTSTFTVDLYFKDDVKPKQYDIVVAMNGDYKNFKIYEQGITAFPGPVTVTTKRLASLFGKTVAELVPGTYFEVRAQFTLQNGTLIPAFNQVGETYSSDLQNLPDASLTLKYQVVCPLDLDDFTGDFVAFEDAFWEETYPVKITREGDNKLRVTNFIDQPTATFLIEVDLAKRTINVPKQVYFTGPLFGYHNFTITGKGEIDACNNAIKFAGSYTVDEGSFGAYPVYFKRP